MTVKRIDISLFDIELKNLINASAKIFPVPYYDVLNNINNGGYEYVRVLDVEHKNEIYVWNNGAWELIGADDLNVAWNDIKNKPVAYNPILHEHAIGDIIDLEEVLASKASTTHTHIHTHPISDITNLQTSLDNKSDISHIHDGRYFTESETTALLGQRAPLVHTHTKSQITDFAHTHDELYAKKELAIGTVQPIDNNMWYKEI